MKMTVNLPLRHPGPTGRVVQATTLLVATTLLALAVIGPPFLEEISDDIPSVLAKEQTADEAEALVRVALAAVALGLLLLVSWADVGIALLLILAAVAFGGFWKDLREARPEPVFPATTRATFDARVKIPAAKIKATGEQLDRDHRAVVIMVLLVRDDEGPLRRVERRHEVALRSGVPAEKPTDDVLVDVRRGERDRRLASFLRDMAAASSISLFPPTPGG